MIGSCLPQPPAPSPCNGEGETARNQVPSPRVETYAQQTRDYRGEVETRSVPPSEPTIEGDLPGYYE
jgi:hypothetical protein